jgi:regulator of sirC expression with transglutaminase-like and TPR domain
MTGSIRFEVPTPLDYFAMLVADDDSLSLVEAAVSIGQDADARLDVQATLSEIDALATRLKRRVVPDAVPLQRLRLLNRFFFQDLGFAGNVNHYHDPRNSHLHEVLRSRRGIPITLAVLYIEFAQQIGLHARGVSFPGHFLVKLRMRQGRQHGEVLIDPFSGRSLSREELAEMLQPYRRSQGLPEEDEAPLGLFLQTASHREVLARMLRNLKQIHQSEEEWAALLAVQRRLVVLLPLDWEERRDRGLAYAELGLWREAAEDLAAYLEHRPSADDAGAVGERLSELRRMRPPTRRG